MQALAQRLLSRRRITVEFVGGSVTAAGLTQPFGFANRFLTWLNRAFPTQDGSPHVAIATSALSGATADFSRTCRQFSEVGRGAIDLVVVELAVNLGYAGPEAVDLLLRAYMHLPSAPAIIVLNWMQSRFGAGSMPGAPLGPSNATREALLTSAARQRGLIAWSSMGAFWELFEWNKTRCSPCCCSGAADLIFLDGRHPTAVGHALIATILIDLLRPSLERADSPILAPPRTPSPSSSRRSSIGQARAGVTATTAAHDSSSTSSLLLGRRHCLTGEALRLASSTSPSDAGSFKWMVEHSMTNTQQPGFVSTLVGDTLDLRVPTGAAYAILVYMQSYERIGSATLGCAGGCQCDGARLVGLNATERVSTPILTRPLRLVHRPSDSTPCTLRVVNTGRLRGMRASSDKFKVLGLMTAVASGGDGSWWQDALLRHTARGPELSR